MLAGSDAPREEQCARYGQALGTAFQIIDDVLDYDGTVDDLGKNLGDDLREGKPTLPLILALQWEHRNRPAGCAKQCAIAIRSGASRHCGIAARCAVYRAATAAR